MVFEQSIPASVERVFEFFSNEKNLEAITPPWLNFKVLRASSTHLNSGTLIDYRLRVRGIPLRWQSRIDDWVLHQKFVDTQTKGPYVYWHHTHEFKPNDGGTLMIDRVRYEIPGGNLGLRLMGNYVASDLQKIFEYRRKKIEELFVDPRL